MTERRNVVDKTWKKGQEYTEPKDGSLMAIYLGINRGPTPMI